MTTLHLVHSREHDLPPMWDGTPVAWGPWSRDTSSVIHHAPVDDIACHVCGVIEQPLLAGGWVPRRVVRLLAVRCGCGHDTVYDEQTGEVWDLDPSDYTDAGSWPEPEQGALF